MAELIDGIGVIIKTSRNTCAVSVTINGSSKSLIFHKKLFYTFGVRCEGSIANILEEGMEVELCYRLSKPQGKCCILAVWLGEKPDIILEDEKSKAIYDVSGRVVNSLDNGNILIKDDHNNIVCINKGVVFRDGSLLPENGSLAIDEEICFDALPIKSEHLCGATHQATCAWIGPRPRLLERFDLCFPDYDTKFPDDIVEGTVAVIPNDIVAIVDVVWDSVLTKVLLFRSSFMRDCVRLGDVLEVGDCIVMRLRFRTIFRGRRWWYAVTACKTNDEISSALVDLDSDTNLCEEVTHEINALNSGFVDKIKLGDSSDHVPNPTIGLTESHSVFQATEGVPLSQSEVVRTLKYFTKKCPSLGYTSYLLNCCGTVIADVFGNDVLVYVKHVVGNSVLKISMAPFLASSPKRGDFLKLNGKNVRFDAKFYKSHSGVYEGHCLATCIRENNESRPEFELMEEALFLSRKTEMPSGTAGTIKAIPGADCAIADFDDVPVLVTLKSLMSFEEINLKTSTIDTYLSVGDIISAKIEKRDFNDKSYFIAVQCFAGESNLSDLDSRRKINAPRRKAWKNIWGFDDYRKGLIVYQEGKFLVTFVSRKRPNRVCNLDLFEKRNVFVNGKSADMEMLKAYVGQQITFHVAHNYFDEPGDSGKGLYVACAWIGEEPHPKLILKELLAVPKGLVSCPWQYEAVVVSFPFPEHALCRIGHIPILVKIGDRTGCKLTDLAVGDLVVVAAFEAMIGDSCILLSNDLMSLKRVSDIEAREVYKYFSGIVVVLPKPVGEIRLVDIGLNASFELCHMRKVNKRSSFTNTKWLAKLSDKMTIGMKVYISVVKTSAKTARYRAIEVYLDKECQSR